MLFQLLISLSGKVRLVININYVGYTWNLGHFSNFVHRHKIFYDVCIFIMPCLLLYFLQYREICFLNIFILALPNLLVQEEEYYLLKLDIIIICFLCQSLLFHFLCHFSLIFYSTLLFLTQSCSQRAFPKYIFGNSGLP